MRVSGYRYRDEWLPNFYPSRVIDGHRVRISRTGKTQILTAAEDEQLDEVFMSDRLFERLERTGHIVTRSNAARVLDDLEVWQSKTHAGPELHIVVLTKRCNLNCTYCHMEPEAVGAAKDRFDLQPEVAEEVIRFALSSPNDAIKFEFQGGEPFLNFAGMKHFVAEAHRQNAAVGKKLRFSVVSNLMLVKDEHLEFCTANGIHISYTLNGPQAVHDAFRKTRSGAGSFEIVLRRLEEIEGRHPGLVSSSPLCVVTAESAPYIRDMIEFFHRHAFRSITIINLKHLGNARHNQLGFDMKRFIPYYLEGLDYIYEKNRPLKEVYAERLVRVVLSKFLGRADTGFVDWRNPCGDVCGTLTYDHDGEILPLDEARSLRSAFSLGNVLTHTYDQVMARKETFRTMNLSLRDRDEECLTCPYNPYCHVSPVLDYARTGDATPVPHVSDECLLTIAVLDWMFGKLLEDPLPLLRMLPGIDPHLVGLLPPHERGAIRPDTAAGA